MSTDQHNETVDPDFSSIHTSSFPELLSRLGISLFVTTYKSGKLILLRNDKGVLNTHLKGFDRPMGIAFNNEKMSLGTHNSIINFRNVPAAISKLEKPENYDACYIPSSSQITGAIDIHEMEYDAKGRLWFINTAFSTLSIYDSESSFIPWWRPGYVTSLADEDRCHLNGLAMKDGKPKYVTALGVSNEPGGWRDSRRDGGVLIDVESNQILIDKLSMPHSPRWYHRSLWYLDSGSGALIRVNPDNMEKQRVAQFPGFGRGLDFIGDFAFIGLSKARETAVFSDFPLLESCSEFHCGVYVFNIHSGSLVGYVDFGGDIEEIFSVKVVGKRFPEVVEPGDQEFYNCYVLPEEYMSEVAIRQ